MTHVLGTAPYVGVTGVRRRRGVAVPHPALLLATPESCNALARAGALTPKGSAHGALTIGPAAGGTTRSVGHVFVPVTRVRAHLGSPHATARRRPLAVSPPPSRPLAPDHHLSTLSPGLDTGELQHSAAWLRSAVGHA